MARTQFRWKGAREPRHEETPQPINDVYKWKGAGEPSGFIFIPAPDKGGVSAKPAPGLFKVIDPVAAVFTLTDVTVAEFSLSHEEVIIYV
tara:strand:- start:6491 stop:6760 length:270 start_codon:yes stop_codon:yes gene_type:complete